MYRAYEDPRKLEAFLRDAERRLSEAQARVENTEDLIDLYESVEELKERINFAWQDDEWG